MPNMSKLEKLFNPVEAELAFNAVLTTLEPLEARKVGIFKVGFSNLFQFRIERFQISGSVLKICERRGHVRISWRKRV
jgi:hypothetical protein